MNKQAKKKCKGTGKSKGHGCGELKVVHRYGLCQKCFSLWLLNTEEGKKVFEKSRIQGKKRAEKERKKEYNEHKKNNMAEGKNFNIYNTTAWKWCKQYVLLYYADSNNIVSCSTSPHLHYHITDKNIHVGHFIKYRDGNSTNNSTAFLFENLAPQSYADNVKFGGKPDIMKQWLIEKHGIDKIDNLYSIKKVPCKIDRYTLFSISEEYKKKYKDLLIKRNIEDPWKNK